MRFNNEQTRRQFIQRQARNLLGVSILGAGSNNIFAKEITKPAKAKSVIYLFMKGGMSHIDTFDMKLDNKEVQGPVKGINTNVTGLKITEHLPKLAKQMNKFAHIRSMHHTQGNHEPGTYYMYTGYPQEPGVIVHPCIGSWVSKQADRLNPNLPIYVRSGSLAGHPANGFFEVQHAPLPISKPTEGLQNSKLGKDMSPEKFQKNLKLAADLDREFLAKYNSKQVRAYTDLYKDAISMMSSKDLAAFDTKTEPLKVRESYGLRNQFGQGCLLARKLVEKGVRFVEVDLGGWDSHTENHKQVAGQCKELDQGLSALMTDLESKGLLDTTLVVVATEFGRTPNIDEYAGRSHNPLGYTCLLAGAGVNGGAIYGKTDKNGKSTTTEPTTALDFNATIGWALGIDPSHMEVPFPGGQKFSISGKDTAKRGKPITQLFS